MGHALQLALADAVIRMKRMQGFNVLFQPGYDHAGISTQNAVEKHLAKDGRTRQELGREAFEALVWDWLREYGGTIMTQFRRIGASLDYGRERFTLDDGYTRAVMRFFVHLYRKGWIYRASRIIHWCPYHQTSLSDLELVHVDTDDTLSTIRYPLDRRLRAHRDRDRPPGDDPGRRRGRGAPGGRAVPRSRGQAGGRPVRRAQRADHRRRAGRARLRHRCAQDHPRPRSEGFRDRPRPRPGGADGDRAGWAHERPRARARGPHPEGRRDADPRLVPRARPAREPRALPAQRRALRALREPHRAAHLASVVVLDGRAEAARATGAARAPRPLPPRVPAPVRDRLARERARLVYLPPALVGASAPVVGVPGRSRHRGGDRARRVRRMRVERAHAERGRARHVVLVGALAVRHPRLAG